MRLGSAQTQARGASYDRNATMKAARYVASGVAPHATTVRTTYTVPSGKKALVDRIYGETYRDTAAGAVSLANIFVEYTPSGGVDYQWARVMHQDNTTFVLRNIDLTGAGLMLAGDVVKLSTSDSSTGGTNVFTLTQKLTEFDA